MHEIIAECCDLFSQRFPICLEFALYDEYKRKYSATEVENHLPQSPRHKFPLKDGWLYKRGDVSGFRDIRLKSNSLYYFVLECQELEKKALYTP